MRVLQELENEEYRRTYGGELAKMDLAVALREARVALGLTQSQLAEKVGVGQEPYIRRLEDGEANPTIEEIGTLLAVLRLRIRFEIVPL